MYGDLVDMESEGLAGEFTALTGGAAILFRDMSIA